MDEKKQPGRPCCFARQIERTLQEALETDPRAFGLKRNRWDEVAVVEYLEKNYGAQLTVRRVQQWIRRLGFFLRQPIYRFAQATTEGMEEFRKTVKKTPDDQQK